MQKSDVTTSPQPHKRHPSDDLAGSDQSPNNAAAPAGGPASGPAPAGAAAADDDINTSTPSPEHPRRAVTPAGSGSRLGAINLKAPSCQEALEASAEADNIADVSASAAPLMQHAAEALPAAAAASDAALPMETGSAQLDGAAAGYSNAAAPLQQPAAPQLAAAVVSKASPAGQTDTAGTHLPIHSEHLQGESASQQPIAVRDTAGMATPAAPVICAIRSPFAQPRSGAEAAGTAAAPEASDALPAAASFPAEEVAHNAALPLQTDSAGSLPSRGSSRSLARRGGSMDDMALLARGGACQTRESLMHPAAGAMATIA